MDDQWHGNHLKDAPKSFIEMFNEYAKDVYGDHRRDHPDELRIDLQRPQHLMV